MAQGRTLTEEMVFTRTKTNRVDLIKSLNLWGNNLQDISFLQCMTNLEVLSLSVNQVNTLRDLQFCPKLSELYLRKNEIHDLSEILHLKGLQEMRVLGLADNPCANQPHYRQFVLHHLPNLVKIDSQDVTDEERRQARDVDFGRVPTRADSDVDSDSGDLETLEPPWDQPPERPGGMAALNPRMARQGNSFEADIHEREMVMAAQDHRRLRQGRSFESDVQERMLPERRSGSLCSDPEGPLERSGSNSTPSAARSFRIDAMHHAEEEHIMRMSHGGERALNKRVSGRSMSYAEESPISPSNCGSLGGGRYSNSYGDPNPPRISGPRQQSWSGPAGPRHSPSPASPTSWGGPDVAWGPHPGPPHSRSQRASQSRAEGRRATAPEADSYHSRFLPPSDRGEYGRGEPPRHMDPDLRADSWGGGVVHSNERAGRADNITCAVLALIKELDEQGLELVRRAVEQRCLEI